MTDTLIKVDLSKSPTDNEMIHNRWHPDIPMACWVNPGDDFILETFDWTGGFIKNNDSADDVRDIDLSIVHFLSGPIGVKGVSPGDLLGVDLDAVVSIERGRIALYQQQQQQQPAAPPPGSGLNQPALLTFRRMTVRSANDRRTVDAFRGKLMQASAHMNGVFVHYDPDEGVWLMKMDAWL